MEVINQPPRPPLPPGGLEKAMQLYTILAGLFLLVGVGLLMCGIVAVINKDDEDKGLPYFLGGFVVGIMALLNSALCARIFLKSPDANFTEEEKQEVGSLMSGHYGLAALTSFCCCFSAVVAGIWGIAFKQYTGQDQEKVDNDEFKKTMAIIILSGCILALLLVICSVRIISKYAPYFGIFFTSGRHGRVVINVNSAGTTLPMTNAALFQATAQGNVGHTRQLESQNRLLQQQLDLQRQLLQQQQQTQYSSGFNQTRPASRGLGNSAFSPAVPPPSYNSVFKKPRGGFR